MVTADIEQLLHITPNGLANFYNIYNPAQGAANGLLGLPEFGNPVQFVVQNRDFEALVRGMDTLVVRAGGCGGQPVDDRAQPDQLLVIRRLRHGGRGQPAARDAHAAHIRR